MKFPTRRARFVYACLGALVINSAVAQASTPTVVALDASPLGDPTGLVIDPAGTPYIVDGYRNTISQISTSGVSRVLVGQYGVRGSSDGAGTLAQFHYPRGLVRSSTGSLYVLDGINGSAIRAISPGAVVTTLAGQSGMGGQVDGQGVSARFTSLSAIALDRQDNIYVTDSDDNSVRKISPAGWVTDVPGYTGNGGSLLRMPSGIAVDSVGNIYVADSLNYVVRKITPAGEFSVFAGQIGTSGHRDGSSSDALFGQPMGLAIDSSDTLYVADMRNHTIRKISAAGEVTTLAGKPDVSGLVDGRGDAARFDYPERISVDAAGNVYVSTTSDHSLRKITPEGVVETLLKGDAPLPVG